MLPDALANAVREVGEAAGGSVLLDARRGRAIVGDPARIVDLCRNLRRAGFSRLVDFTAIHNATKPGVAQPSVAVQDSVSPTAQPTQPGTAVPPLPSTIPDGFTLLLTLRAPEHQHAALTLKWKWPPTTYTAPGGTGQPGDELQAGPVIAVHPSLATIWLAAAVAEREMFEMFGLPFAGNALEPLLLDQGFAGNPLRADYVAPRVESYAQRLLQQRHEQGLIDALIDATEGGGYERGADLRSAHLYREQVEERGPEVRTPDASNAEVPE